MNSTQPNKSVQALIKSFQTKPIDNLKEHELAASLALEAFPTQYKLATGIDWDITKSKVIEKLAKSNYDAHWITKPAPVECKHIHLFILAKNANSKLISEYIRKNGKASADAIDSVKRTPLHVAAAHGNTDAVDILIKYSKIDVLDKYLRTPLQMACLSGKPESVKLLITKGKGSPKHKDSVS